MWCHRWPLPMVNLQAFALKSLIPFREVITESLDCLICNSTRIPGVKAPPCEEMRYVVCGWHWWYVVCGWYWWYVVCGAKDAACTRSLCSIRSGSTNGINLFQICFSCWAPPIQGNAPHPSPTSHKQVTTPCLISLFYWRSTTSLTTFPTLPDARSHLLPLIWVQIPTNLPF